jgi:hypothetical protein
LTVRAGGATGSNIATSERELNAPTEDPGSFTVGLAFSLAATIAIHPT